VDGGGGHDNDPGTRERAMSRPRQTAIIGLLAGVLAGPAAAQMLGPTWETDIVLTKGDYEAIDRTLERAVHGRAVGTVAMWRNPSTGHSGTLELMRKFKRSGQRCERIDYTIRGDGRGGPIQHWVFDSCRQPDGSWKLAIN
jgi:surface antigen